MLPWMDRSMSSKTLFQPFHSDGGGGCGCAFSVLFSNWLWFNDMNRDSERLGSRRE
jgi:hypothetical protein